MNVNVLEDILATVKLTGSSVHITSLAAPWGFTVGPNKNDVLFMLVVEGQCHLEVAEGMTRSLTAGDIVVMPWGSSHTLKDTIETPAYPLEEVESRQRTARGARTRFAIGCYRTLHGGRDANFFFLPALIHLPMAEYGNVPEIALTAQLFLQEANKDRAYQSVILSRLAEVFFMQVLRLYSLQTPAGWQGWLRGLSDPPVAAALQALHSSPGEPWTVASLASQANLSRSMFAERFHEVVGEPPLQYLQRWRMQKAALLLSGGGTPLKAIMRDLGYTSGSAFRKAFQRWYGMLPSEYPSENAVSAS
jgi:AraC-like DNA-binding protein